MTIVDLIIMKSNEVLNFYKVKRDSHYVSNMWANITTPITGTAHDP